MTKYCLPIIKNTKNEVLKEISENLNEYEYFEIWLDYINDLDELFIKIIMEKLAEKLIIVFRRKNLEETKISFEDRMDIISVFKSSRILLDLDIFNQKKELDYLQKKALDLKVIVSYHNYEETPSDEKLNEIIDTMKIYNPFIFKIATYCNNQKDALRLLSLLLAIKKEDVKCIILGMGQLGIVTRIFGSFWGNEMIFAPKEDSQKSAQGQLTKNELELVFKILGE